MRYERKIMRMQISNSNGSIASLKVQAAIRLEPSKQRDFWNALHAPVVLTPAQKKLAKVARGGEIS